MQCIGDGDTLPTERSLGVTWDVQHDIFIIVIKPKTLADTHRKAVSLTASIFDPVGSVASYVVKAKILLQSLWKLCQSWDERIPEKVFNNGLTCSKVLEKLAEFFVPRFYRRVPLCPMSIQLHVFGKASETAFCASAYFRFVYPGGWVQCGFVAAKTRVAPVRSLSIPKLELHVAVLGVQLGSMLKKGHDFDNSAV